MGGGEIVGEPDQGILEGAQAFGAGAAVAVALELALGLGAGVVDELLEPLDQRDPERGILAGIAVRKRRGLLAQGVEVEIGRRFDDRLVHGPFRPI